MRSEEQPRAIARVQDLPAVAPPEALPLSVRNEGQPGFIKRYADYDLLRRKAESFTGTAYSKPVIAAAARSIPGLTRAEEKVLLEALDIIPKQDYAEPSGGIVFARNKVFAGRGNMSEDAVKAAKRGLERKGLVIRHPDGDNNACKLDLRPFLADLDEHLAYRLGIDEQRRTDDAMGGSFATLVIKEETPLDEKITPHIQSSITNNVSLVQNGTESANPADNSKFQTDASRSNHPERRLDGAANSEPPKKTSDRPTRGTAVICSAGRASGGAGRQHGSSLRAERPRAALLEAYQLSPRWQGQVSLPDVESLALDRLYAGTWEMIRTQFPEATRNHDQTWKWAIERHGWRAIIMAIVAVEDPSVRNPARYFGALVTRADGIDLALNLSWMVKHRAELESRLAEPDELEADEATPLPCPAPPSVPAEWFDFLERLRQTVPAVELKPWIGSIGFLDLGAGTLTLIAGNRFNAEWIERHHRQALQAAGRDVGWRVHNLRFKWPE